MSPTGWPEALESLNEYCKSSYDLPSDHSLISPIARVILQKRRLLKIEEIHSLLLEASCDPSESLIQGEYEKDYLNRFRPTFVNIHWNELSVCEAQAISSLIVDTLLRCQADAHLINLYIKDAIDEIENPDFDERMDALRSSLILIRAIFVAFPKQACQWANNLLKSILNNFKLSQKKSNHFDCVLEALRCLQVILRLPSKFTDQKEKEKVLVTVTKYLNTSSPFIAIEAAKVFEAYYAGKDTLTKVEVRSILESLNGALSFRLNEYKCSPRLLEFCFEFKSEKPNLDLPTLFTNIARVRTFTYIDNRLFADAFANVLIKWSEEDAMKILVHLKSKVSSKCFANVTELFLERLVCSQSIKYMSFLLDICDREPSIELLDTLTRLYKKFPGSLTETDFSTFAPLSDSNDLIQVKTVELICTVLNDNPIALTGHVAMLFAQLKGDFLRLKLKEPNVSKVALLGLLKLFAKILKVSLESYSNYCDHEVIKRIQDWILHNFTLDEESGWIRSEPEILRGLLLVAAVLTDLNSSSDFVQSITNVFMNMTETVNYESFLQYFLCVTSSNFDLYRLIYGSIEKCFHELNLHNKISYQPNCRKLFLLMKMIIDSKKLEYNSAAIVNFVAKAIAFTEFAGKFVVVEDFDLIESAKEPIKFIQFTEIFAKMYWKSSEQNRDYCMTLWQSSLKNKTAMIPSQILQTIRAILECSELKASGNEATQVQEIAKVFLADENFNVRLECGIVLGLIVRLIGTDNDAINDLYKQFMKHAMKSDSKEQKSRVSYIMGLVTLKANLELENAKSAVDLSHNALIRLISSWNRENDAESKQFGREIAAASMYTLAYYIEKCGCVVNAEFYRDSCELLLEQVFLRNRCEKLVQSVLELAKSLGLYVNFLSSQSQFITKTIRLLIETNFLAFYVNCNIDILIEISLINPKIAEPSALIYKLLKKSIVCYKRGAFGKICQYLHLQLAFNPRFAFEMIDSGVFIMLLERANNMECFSEFDQEQLSLVVQKITNLTLMERFDYWLNVILDPMNLNGYSERKPSIKTNSPVLELSNSTFSLNDLRESLRLPISLRASTVLMLLTPLSQNLSKLTELDLNAMRKFLTASIRVCVNISAEKFNDRKFYLAGILLFRGIIRTFSGILDESRVSVLEPFDSQIVSVISSALRLSEEGDPLYAACAYGALYSLVYNRQDLHEDLKSGNGRVYTLLKKSCSIFKTHEIDWTVESVDNLVELSIITGMCSLKKGGFDLNVLEPNIFECLCKQIEKCFIAYNDDSLDKNVPFTLSESDRLLLMEIWILSEPKDFDFTVIEGIISMLNKLNSGNMEQICTLSMKLFELKSVKWEVSNNLSSLLDKIVGFGLEKKDPLAIECLLNCNFENSFYLDKLCQEFLTMRFSDFDSHYGLMALKAQQSLRLEDQGILFKILKKLVNSCLNDLEVNHCKDTLTTVKAIFTDPNVSEDESNDLMIAWFVLLEEVDSIFLNQLVFFVISTRPQIFREETLKGLLKHLKKLLKSANTIEMALDSWILLLKAQSKNSELESFCDFVNVCTEQVEGAFEKHRGIEIDPVWERIFSIAQSISNLEKVKQLVAKSLEELNDFK